MEAVDILLRGNGIDTPGVPLSSPMACGNGDWDEDSVAVIALVQPLHERQRSSRERGRQPLDLGAHAALNSRLQFARNVELDAGFVANEDQRDARRTARLGGEPFDGRTGFSANRLSDGRSSRIRADMASGDESRRKPQSSARSSPPAVASASPRFLTSPTIRPYEK